MKPLHHVTRPARLDELQSFIEGLYWNYPIIRDFEMTKEAHEDTLWMVPGHYVAFDMERHLYLFKQTVSNLNKPQLKDPSELPGDLDVTPLDDNALTDREWRLVQLWEAGKMIGGHARGKVVLGLPDDHRRAAAAIALYGQEYGFDHYDVKGLRMLADAHEYFIGEAVRNLADRIERLLPPNKETSETPGI